MKRAIPICVGMTIGAAFLWLVGLYTVAEVARNTFFMCSGVCAASFIWRKDFKESP